MSAFKAGSIELGSEMETENENGSAGDSDDEELSGDGSLEPESLQAAAKTATPIHSAVAVMDNGRVRDLICFSKGEVATAAHPGCAR